MAAPPRPKQCWLERFDRERTEQHAGPSCHCWSKLREAGTFTVCRLVAGKSKMVSFMYGLESNQVSKTSPTGK